ncbi:carbohydrate ABC transporter permease [Cohnella abietis]|uniref:Sugar ABC transporter permease n=1 Tax=Cohnella abietis TaxID=2507935 RepID=A0A3T1DEA7_9BACL|nr:carbohydrate ABC transporter permease [Cohnella abietis]BBI36496.1 sugar ABC transporter permease [Cohnella abietis]
MKLNAREVTFQTLNYLVFTVFTVVCIYPFYYLLIVSLSDPQEASKGLVTFWPIELTFNNYAQILKIDGIGRAFFISGFRAIIGTVLTLLFTSMFAYGLTKQRTFGRKFMYRAVVISMYLNAGLIPWFITMKMLGLKDSFLLYILPGLIGPFFLILIKTYFEQISAAIEESALVDGAGYFTIFLKIIMPISTPIVAAVAVFSAVGHWNSWQDNFFLVSDRNLQTIQLVLLNFLRESETIAQQLAQNQNGLQELANANRTLTPFTIKTTITMVVSIPIICVYPWLQKYFVKGIMLGAVKG